MSGDGALRFGVNDQVEAQINGVTLIEENGRGSMQMGHVGGKFSIAPGVLSATGGAGFGFSQELGSMASVDAGVILGYENRYFVPFTSLRGYISKPIFANMVALTTSEDGVTYDTPTTTHGWTFATGFKIPLQRDAAGSARGHRAPYKSALVVDSSFTIANDRDGEAVFFNSTIGFELKL